MAVSGRSRSILVAHFAVVSSMLIFSFAEQSALLLFSFPVPEAFLSLMYLNFPSSQVKLEWVTFIHVPSLSFIGRLHDSLDNFLIRFDLKRGQKNQTILELNLHGYIYFFSGKFEKMFLDYQWADEFRF